MAEALSSTSKSPISTHDKNIGMLLDKLKEFGMSTENATETRIIKRVESKFSKMNLFTKKYDYIDSRYISLRFAPKRS